MVVFAVWLFVGIGLALILIRQSSWTLFLGTIGLTLYGGLAAIESVRLGGVLQNSQFKLTGEALLLFFSVLGSALIGVALSEIRSKRARS